MGWKGEEVVFFPGERRSVFAVNNTIGEIEKRLDCLNMSSYATMKRLGNDKTASLVVPSTLISTPASSSAQHAVAPT